MAQSTLKKLLLLINQSAHTQLLDLYKIACQLLHEPTKPLIKIAPTNYYIYDHIMGIQVCNNHGTACMYAYQYC